MIPYYGKKISVVTMYCQWLQLKMRNHVLSLWTNTLKNSLIHQSTLMAPEDSLLNEVVKLQPVNISIKELFMLMYDLHKTLTTCWQHNTQLNPSKWEMIYKYLYDKHVETLSRIELPMLAYWSLQPISRQWFKQVLPFAFWRMHEDHQHAEEWHFLICLQCCASLGLLHDFWHAIA